MTVFAIVLDGWRWTLRESACAAWVDAAGRDVRSAVVHGQHVYIGQRRGRTGTVRVVDGRLDHATSTLPREVIDRAVDSLLAMRRAA